MSLNSVLLCQQARVNDIAVGIALMLFGTGLAFFLGKPFIQPQAPRLPAIALGDWSSSPAVRAALEVNVLFIIGAMLVSFSKEKNEDEYIAGLRLSSLLWAVFVSYVLLLAAFLLVYGSPFLDVMVYNMFTILIIFITRFNYLMYKNSKTATDEK